MIFVQLGCGENHLAADEFSLGWYVQRFHSVITAMSAF
jgi:hypothetical protein